MSFKRNNVCDKQFSVFEKNDLKCFSSTLNGFSRLVKENQNNLNVIKAKENMNRKLVGVWSYDLKENSAFKNICLNDAKSILLILCRWTDREEFFQI